MRNNSILSNALCFDYLEASGATTTSPLYVPHWGHTLPCSFVAPHLHTSRVGASSLELLERLLSLLALDTFFFGTAISHTSYE